MTRQQAVMLALQASILLTVFTFGLQATLDDLLYMIRRPALLARSLVAMFIVMPVVAVALVQMFELRPTFEIALIALAISPTPPLLPGKETKAGVHTGYGLGLMAVVSVLAIGVLPLWVELLSRYFERPLQMPPAAVAKVMVTMTMLPLVAGMIVRAATPSLAIRLLTPARVVGTVLLVAAAGALLVAALPAITPLVDVRVLVVLAAFVGAGLGAGHWLGGPRTDESTVLALSTATRHPAIAFAVAKINFPDEPFLGATILLYLIVVTALSVPYVFRQRRLLIRNAA